MERVYSFVINILFIMQINIYSSLATRPGFAQVVEHIMGTNMFCRPPRWSSGQHV